MPDAAQHLYADPHVYDVLHDDQTASDLRILERLARRAAAIGPGPTLPAGPLRWLEPACGSGRYLLALARKGHDAEGFDISPAMVAYARSRARELGLARRARARVARMERFARAPGSVHIAFNLINSIRHLGSDRALIEHLRRVGRSLHPAGSYVVGISLSAYGLEQPSEDVWKGKRGPLRVSQVVQFVPPTDASRGPWARRERVFSHLTITGAGREEHRDSRYWLRTYNQAQWEACIAKAGLRVALIADGAGVVCLPHEPGYFLYALCPALSAASLRSLPAPRQGQSPRAAPRARRRS